MHMFSTGSIDVLRTGYTDKFFESASVMSFSASSSYNDLSNAFNTWTGTQRTMYVVTKLARLGIFD